MGTTLAAYASPRSLRQSPTPQVETMLKFVIIGLVGFALAAHALPAPSAAVDGSALSPADSEFGIVQHPVLGGHLLLLRAPSVAESRRSKRSPFFPRLINQVFPNFIPALDRFEERNRGGFLEDFIDIEREFFN